MFCHFTSIGHFRSRWWDVVSTKKTTPQTRAAATACRSVSHYRLDCQSDNICNTVVRVPSRTLTTPLIQVWHVNAYRRMFHCNGPGPTDALVTPGRSDSHRCDLLCKQRQDVR
jgi:hypothetical protein